MELLYSGKAKNVYKTKDSDIIRIEFTDKATAGNGLKADEFETKGRLNLEISTILYSYLEKNGINTHLISYNIADNIQDCYFCKLIPLEVIIRNKAAGSMARTMGVVEGCELSRPVFELSYKDDSLNDPFINDDYAYALNIVNEDELNFIKETTFKINELLIALFKRIKLDLIDFKIEFGINNEGNIMLIDEISPDTMRLWDVETLKKMDKDNFRLEVGDLISSYKEVLDRLKGLNV